MRVKLFCGWGKDDNFLQDFVDSWGVTKYKNMEFVRNDWTHAVIFNRVYEGLKVSKENAIGFTHEPRNNSRFLEGDYIAWLCNNVKTYFIDDTRDLPTNTFKLGQGFISNEYGINKDKIYKHDNEKIAIIASHKKWREGHQFRHKLIDEILKTKMDIDIWGDRILTCYQDSRVKGNFGDNKEVYENYKYVIVVESDKNDYYVSEKFFNAVAYNCIPIYWGANKIKDWYGNCCIELPNNVNESINIIRNVYNNPVEINMQAVKELIKYSEQYAPEFIWRQFN